jgi:hypothetical protein
MKKGHVIAFISAPGVGTSFLTKQMACRHMCPGFFEGEEGIFTTSVLDVLNNEVDSIDRYKWFSGRTKMMMERARAIADLGMDVYVDGDVLLIEAWHNAEIGDKSPAMLEKWLEENKHLEADKVLVLIASKERMQENMVKRGRASEQNDFIRNRALRVGKECANLEKKYKHVKVLDRSNLEFTKTAVLEQIDEIIKKIPFKV